MAKAKEKIEKEISNNSNTYNITVAAGESSFTLGNADISYELEGENVLDEAKEYCIAVLKGTAKKEKRDFSVTVVLSEASKEIIKAKAKATLCKAPVDATFSGVSEGKPQFTDEVAGYTVDEDALIASIAKMLGEGNYEGKVTANLITVKANITKADLSEKRGIMSLNPQEERTFCWSAEITE
jgi:hypothetical protein